MPKKNSIFDFSCFSFKKIDFLCGGNFLRLQAVYKVYVTASWSVWDQFLATVKFQNASEKIEKTKIIFFFNFFWAQQIISIIYVLNTALQLLILVHEKIRTKLPTGLKNMTPECLSLLCSGGYVNIISRFPTDFW